MKWWQIRKRDEDLERELRSDLELEEEEQRDNGKSPEEAHYAARRAFGNQTLIKEHTHEAGVGRQLNSWAKTFATDYANSFATQDSPLWPSSLWRLELL